MRSSRRLAETGLNTNQNVLMDYVALSRAYEKMISLCLDFQMEILTDIEIRKQDILHSFIDLPNISSYIYSTELSSRLHAFLRSFPPSEPTPHVVRLVIAAADFQRDLSLWNISYTEGGVDARELFRPYITQWIEDKRCALLALCKIKVNLPSDSNHATFVDDIYNQLNDTLAEYASIINRWPEEYSYMLENAIADVGMAVVERLEQQYAEVLAPLRKSKIHAKCGPKFVQKLVRGSVCLYSVSEELGIILNSMNRILNFLGPTIESQVRSWGSYMPESGNTVPAGESLAEVAVVTKFKFRGYLEAVVDKLVMNTKLHSVTKLKKIIKDAKENAVKSDLRHRMEELFSRASDQLQWDRVLETQVLVMICRGLWDRMGKDILKFLGKRKKLRSWCKAS